MEKPIIASRFYCLALEKEFIAFYKLHSVDIQEIQINQKMSSNLELLTQIRGDAQSNTYNSIKLWI